MRTTFCEMHLFNDTSQKHDKSFILNRKQWGKGKLERERDRQTERERDRQRERERERKRKRDIEQMKCGSRSVAEKELRRGS